MDFLQLQPQIQMHNLLQPYHVHLEEYSSCAKRRKNYKEDEAPATLKASRF